MAEWSRRWPMSTPTKYFDSSGTHVGSFLLPCFAFLFEKPVQTPFSRPARSRFGLFVGEKGVSPGFSNSERFDAWVEGGADGVGIERCVYRVGEFA